MVNLLHRSTDAPPQQWTDSASRPCHPRTHAYVASLPVGLDAQLAGPSGWRPASSGRNPIAGQGRRFIKSYGRRCMQHFLTQQSVGRSSIGRPAAAVSEAKVLLQRGGDCGTSICVPRPWLKPRPWQDDLGQVANFTKRFKGWKLKRWRTFGNSSGVAVCSSKQASKVNMWGKCGDVESKMLPTLFFDRLGVHSSTKIIMWRVEKREASSGLVAVKVLEELVEVMAPLFSVGTATDDEHVNPG